MLRKSVASLVVVVLFVGSLSAATLAGRIKEVNADKNTFVVVAKGGTETTITADKNTKITLDKDRAKFAGLKVARKSR